jgi:hypothetical protein
MDANDAAASLFGGAGIGAKSVITLKGFMDRPNSYAPRQPAVAAGAGLPGWGPDWKVAIIRPSIAELGKDASLCKIGSCGPQACLPGYTAKSVGIQAFTLGGEHPL